MTDLDTYLADYVGPEGSGIRAFLIDPGCIEHEPGARRIDLLLGQASRLDEQRLAQSTPPVGSRTTT